MDTLAGFEKTGRVTIGPGSDLVELSDDGGLKHTAILFHPDCRDHSGIHAALEPVKGFLEAPYVTGLSELVAHDAQESAFVYPTGDAWSVYDVVRTWSDMGETPGIRAGLELMYSAGSILVEAAEAAEPQGIYSHGAITPWRVLIKPDGQVEIIGYALPQVEILQFQEDAQTVPREDSFRYCPPERLEGLRENLSADLFCLSLVAFEMMTGRPVYDGLVNDIRTQAARGEGRRRLFRFKDVLPNSVRDLLTVALRAQPEDRFGDGDGFLEGVRMVLGGPDADGPSLYEVMERLQGHQRRSGEGLKAAKTTALSQDEIKNLLGDEVDDILQAREEHRARKKGGERKSFSPTAKPRGRAAPAAKPPAAEPPPRRAEPPARGAEPRSASPRRSVSRTPPPEPAAPPPRAEAPAPTEDDLKQSSSGRWNRPDPGRRRRRARSEPEGDASALTESTSGSAEDVLARLRKSRSVNTRRPGKSSASDVINKILSTSGGPAPGLPPDPPADPPSVDTPKPRGRRPRRGGGSAGDLLDSIKAKPAPVAPITPPGGALGHQETRVLAQQSREELLAAEDAQAKKTSPIPPPVDSGFGGGAPDIPINFGGELAASQPPRAAPPRPAPPRVEPPRRDPPPQKRPIPTPRPAPAVRPSQPPPQQRPPVSDFRPSTEGLRPPDPLQTPSGGGGSQKMRIFRGPGGKVIKVPLSVRATLAEVVVLLTGLYIPMRTDLSGRVALNYRIGPASGPADGNTTVGTFSTETPLMLHPVPMRERWAELEIEHLGARFRAPIASTVTAASVADHLCQMYGLPAGAWKLYTGGAVISPYLLIEELDLSSPLVLKQ